RDMRSLAEGGRRGLPSARLAEVLQFYHDDRLSRGAQGGDDDMKRQAVIDYFQIEWKINRLEPLEALVSALDAAEEEAAAALSALPAAQVKGLEWRYYPDAFPPMYVSQNAAFGHYTVE